LVKLIQELGDFYMRMNQRRKAEIYNLMAEANGGKCSKEHTLEMIEATFTELKQGANQYRRFVHQLKVWLEQEKCLEEQSELAAGEGDPK
jgi:hypothetical protein